MGRKLILLSVLAIFLTACGASAPEMPMTDGPVYSAQTQYGSGETYAAVSPEMMEDAVPAEAELMPEYFRFEKRSGTVANDDGLTILYENQCIPVFFSGDEARGAWVQEILNGIDRDYNRDSANLLDYAGEFLDENGADHFYSYSNYQQLGIARHDERVVSLISLSSLYSGGSHPNSVQTTYNLDIERQRILTLEDIVAESGTVELARMVRAGVDEKFAPIDGGNGLYENYAATIENSFVYGSMTPYWYLSSRGLVIFYNQYELGPYAAGIIKVELPYENLDGILLEEYVPQEPDGTYGDLVLGNSSEGRRTIPIIIDPAGGRLTVGVEGRVHQVRLSEILWLEDTPIAQDVLFCALSLGENDVLELTGGYDDENRSFAIEFTDGGGEVRVYYIHANGLTEEP